MPSASEMQRSLSEQYEEACDRANNLSLGKHSREQALREARSLAEELGIEGPPPVNGRPAGEQKQDDERSYDKLKQKLAESLRERAEALGWYKKDGSFTQQGKDEGLSYLIGAHVALQFCGEHGVGNLIFLSSVRGVDDVLDLKRK